MEHTLEKLSHFSGRTGPCLCIILDGVGIAKAGEGNAFELGNPENLKKWMEQAKSENLYTELKAHGTSVGLPTDGDMGNSEVGHNALGSGQVYSQGAKLVNESILSGRIFQSDVWKKVVTQTGKAGKTVHLIGLLSDGNVHSHINQLIKLIDGIVDSGVKRIRLHPLLDGRDVARDSALIYIEQIEEKLQSLQTKEVDAKIGSGGGRMYMTMDRYYSDWKMVERGWNAHVRGVIADEDRTEAYSGYFQDAKTAIETARKVYPKKFDQFNPPFVIVDDKNNPVGKVQDGDAVINFNFRGDRAIEISEAFVKENFDGFDRVEYPNVEYAGLLEYDSESHIPPQYLVQPPDINNVLSEYLCAMNIKSYAVSETHKFGHVTYFWNGNRSGYINKSLEKYEEIPSDPNDMIEAKPEMKAKEITELLLNALKSKEYQFLRVNYANGDMVGHTGNIESCVQAVKYLDDVLPKVIEEVKKQDGIVIITADHGNVEEKIDKKGKVKTSHTLNPVPFFIIDSKYNKEYVVKNEGNKGIANVTATILNLMGFKAPDFYEESLVSFS